jgi:hypothetical protein
MDPKPRLYPETGWGEEDREWTRTIQEPGKKEGTTNIPITSL